ncbi:MAG TPA: 6-phosphofructokinase [Candidatus Bathyarchaeia archaeon]|nr:6-phosphofructokinase [Candidatus Bathyarchaeia archaeon]
MKKIGVVTSGGDAPGINAAIRAVVRTAYSMSLEVVGFQRGWEGVMTNDSKPLTPRSVGGILHLGGTILHTHRCPEFETKKGTKKAARTLTRADVEGLVVIGGDGSFRGACALSKETDTLIVGVPATIDNDVYGTDETIGFDTAVNTAVTEIDKVRDTAISHERTFIVEVMGRDRGFLALTAGLTSGAEVIIVPEIKTKTQTVVQTLRENWQKGKRSSIIVKAEGAGDARLLAKEIETRLGSEVRISVLGYAQRGGSPTARSRLLASLFGNQAVDIILKGQGNKIVGLQNGQIGTLNMEKSCNSTRPLDLNLLLLANVLAT